MFFINKIERIDFFRIEINTNKKNLQVEYFISGKIEVKLPSNFCTILEAPISTFRFQNVYTQKILRNLIAVLSIS